VLVAAHDYYYDDLDHLHSFVFRTYLAQRYSLRLSFNNRKVQEVFVQED
jgi:hypothetical protein